MPNVSQPIMSVSEFHKRLKLNGWKWDGVEHVLIPVPGKRPLRVKASVRRTRRGYRRHDYGKTLARCWRVSDAAGLPKWG